MRHFFRKPKTPTPEMIKAFPTDKTGLIDQIENQVEYLGTIGNTEAMERKSNKLQAEIEQHQDKLKPIIEAHAEDSSEKSALEWAIAHTRAKKIYQLRLTSENADELRNYQSSPPTDYEKPTKNNDPSSSLKATIAPQLRKAMPHIDAQAKATAKQQALHDAHAKQKLPEQQLAEARDAYKDGMDDIKTRLENLLNPNPDALKLKGIEKELSQLDQQYQKQVETIYKEAGIHRLLQSIKESKDKNKNIMLIPVLETSEYQLNGKDIPQSLIQLQSLTIEVNNLLIERQEMENTITAYPSAAASMKEDIAENTRLLKEKMATLTTTVETLHPKENSPMPSLLATHPDIEHFAKKAGALLDALHRKDFFQRKKVPGILKLHPLLYALSQDRRLGIPAITYDTKAVETMKNDVTTETWVQDGMYNWHKEGLKCDWTVEEGKQRRKLKDKNGKEIELPPEDVKFSGKEFADLYATFTQQHNLTAAKAPKITQIDANKFQIKWSNKNDAKTWNNYLKNKYQGNRLKEINKGEPEKKKDAGVEAAKGNNNADAIDAKPTLTSNALKKNT